MLRILRRPGVPAGLVLAGSLLLYGLTAVRSPGWLDAAKNPDIVFTSRKVTFGKEKTSAEVVGDFTLHGVTKEITVTVSWKPVPQEAAEKAGFPKGEWLRFTTEFDVKLSEYGVKVPDMAVAKVSDTWKVRMSVFAGTAKPAEKK